MDIHQHLKLLCKDQNEEVKARIASAFWAGENEGKLPKYDTTYNSVMNCMRVYPGDLDTLEESLGIQPPLE
ncbi:MAG: hypothetical protein AABY07_00765 [Nanoarchaeota archaeon]